MFAPSYSALSWVISKWYAYILKRTVLQKRVVSKWYDLHILAKPSRIYLLVSTWHSASKYSSKNYHWSPRVRACSSMGLISEMDWPPERNWIPKIVLCPCQSRTRMFECQTFLTVKICLISSQDLRKWSWNRLKLIQSLCYRSLLPGQSLSVTLGLAWGLVILGGPSFVYFLLQSLSFAPFWPMLSSALNGLSTRIPFRAYIFLFASRVLRQCLFSLKTGKDVCMCFRSRPRLPLCSF